VARPKSYPSDLRQRLVSAAADRLAHHGPNALSLRELAQSQGTSTSAIYTIFGGKAELIEAIVREAHDSFSAAQREALGAGDSLECLQRLGMAYRRWALDHSSLYLVMFGCHPEAPPPDIAFQSFEPLLNAVSHLIEAGTLRPSDARLLARSMWAAVHGWVMLEITGGAERLPNQVFQLHLDTFMTGAASDATRAAQASLRAR